MEVPVLGQNYPTCVNGALVSISNRASWKRVGVEWIAVKRETYIGTDSLDSLCEWRTSSRSRGDSSRSWAGMIFMCMRNQKRFRCLGKVWTDIRYGDCESENVQNKGREGISKPQDRWKTSWKRRCTKHQSPGDPLDKKEVGRVEMVEEKYVHITGGP